MTLRRSTVLMGLCIIHRIGIWTFLLLKASLILADYKEYSNQAFFLVLTGALAVWWACSRYDFSASTQLSARHLLKASKVCLSSFDRIINNYWTRLSEISWFGSDEQINYLPKPKANNWSARHWQITIFCDNRRICFREAVSAAFSRVCHFHTRAWFSISHAQNVICSKKHSWTELRVSRPLFVASYLQVSWFAQGQWKLRKKLHQMVIGLARE